MMFPKHVYVRNKRLLEAARHIPCQHCGAEDGTVVAAHSNMARHGKGRGIKADDTKIASLCHACHMELDQGNTLSRMGRELMWINAHLKTISALTELGLWTEPHENGASDGHEPRQSFHGL